MSEALRSGDQRRLLIAMVVSVTAHAVLLLAVRPPAIAPMTAPPPPVSIRVLSDRPPVAEPSDERVEPLPEPERIVPPDPPAPPEPVSPPERVAPVEPAVTAAPLPERTAPIDPEPAPTPTPALASAGAAAPVPPPQAPAPVRRQSTPVSRTVTTSAGPDVSNADAAPPAEVELPAFTGFASSRGLGGTVEAVAAADAPATTTTTDDTPRSDDAAPPDPSPGEAIAAAQPAPVVARERSFAFADEFSSTAAVAVEARVRELYAWQDAYAAEIEAWRATQRAAAATTNAAPDADDRALSETLDRLLAAIESASSDAAAPVVRVSSDGPGTSGGGDGVAISNGSRRRTFGPAPDLDSLTLPAATPARYPLSVRFVVLADGSVARATVFPSSISADLDARVAAAVERWRFEPVPGSAPVEATVTVIVDTTR